MTIGQRNKPSSPISPIRSAAYSCHGIGELPSIVCILLIAGPYVAPVGLGVANRGRTKLGEGFIKLVISFTFTFFGGHS